MDGSNASGAPTTDVAAAARRWADEWAAGWREHDSARIASLYADDAVFRSAPFRDPEDPRRYADWAFADEDAVECRFGEPVVAGNRALVEYWAVITSGGNDETLFGIALLRFGPDGRVVEQRDYWHMEPGRRKPFDEWGR
jgi:ketosteroid isomerase-like protein